MNAGCSSEAPSEDYQWQIVSFCKFDCLIQNDFRVAHYVVLGWLCLSITIGKASIGHNKDIDVNGIHKLSDEVEPSTDIYLVRRVLPAFSW